MKNQNFEKSKQNKKERHSFSRNKRKDFSDLVSCNNTSPLLHSLGQDVVGTLQKRASQRSNQIIDLQT